jgi:hypothetical protein
LEKRNLLKWLAGAALLLWLVGILFPMAWASRFHASWNEWFNRVFAPTWVHILMHAVLYAVLALGLNLLLGGHLSMCQLWGIVLLVAFAQEGLQLLGAARLPAWSEVFDLVVDGGGAAIGMLIWRCLRGR